MTDFTHLHVHSYYSLMDGLNSPAELLDAAKDLGQDAISITDHGGLSAHRELQREAKARGMKPVLGLEAYISPTDRFDRRAVKKRDDNTQAYNHIILLAKNAGGYRNLNTLSELAWTEGFYSKPRIDRELLEEYRDGLIVLSGCMNGLIAKAIEREVYGEARILTRWFKNTFEDDFYMEVQPHNPPLLNRELLNLADQFDVKPVATGDCHFARKEDKAVEEAMLILSTAPKIGKGATYDDGKKKKDIFERLNYLYPDRAMTFEDIDLYVHGRADVETGFKESGIDRTDIYENTLEITDKIGDYEYHENVNLLPKPRGQNPGEILRKKVYDGLRAKGLYDNPVYKSRADEELDIIVAKFPTYFLIEANAVAWAKSKSILVGPGRGSAAGSLVCYALGITNVDPIEHNLLFFRFINPERMEAHEFPDIDTDFEDRRRGEVKEYMRKRYGNVADIATFGYFKDKGVVRDAARVFLVPLGDVNKALKGVDTFEEFMASESTKDFRRKYPEVIELAQKLRGRIRTIGKHAGGIVVSKEPIANYAPMQTAKDNQADERVPVVALDMNEIAKIGLIKYDFLGLKALSVISDTLQTIRERHGRIIDLENLPMDDKRVYQMLSEGNTKGVFQCEQGPYTNLLVRMGGVSNFDELAASNALVRPGAMDSTAGANFIARKNGRAIPSYHHEDMTWFTKETYGTIIYQEQVMLTMTELAGMSMGTADKVRKIIGKKRDVSEFEQYKAEFVDGASRKVPVKVAELLWHDFEAHANYSFNKSHAVAYSMLSYWTAWLKVNYPLEFMTAILKNEKDKDARTDYLTEAKRMGVRIVLPHVNQSDLDFSIQEDARGSFIRFGLSNIKFISGTIGSRLIDYRPFQSYQQLYDKVMEKNSGLSTRTLQALNAVGGAVFDDNPRKGNERENFYEYLNIPAFESKDLSPMIKAQFKPLEDFDPEDAFVTMAMVRGIKRGPGWARLDLMDSSGNAGVFADENTPIEQGKMYVFLIASNRVMRYITPQELIDNKGGAFQRFLEATSFPDIPDSMVRVVSFQSRITKAGKRMATVVFCDNQKQLQSALVWPSGFPKAHTKCKDGAVLDVQFDTTDDGAVFVKNIL